MKRTYPESNLQTQCVAWCNDYLYKTNTNAIIFKIDNESKRTPQAGARAKKLGLYPGIPDLAFVFNGITYYIELKAHGGRLSDNQKLTHEKLSSMNASVVTVDNIKSFQNHILDIVNTA